MKRQTSAVELLGIINKQKQEGKALDEIIENMRALGLHEENTKEFYSMLN